VVNRTQKNMDLVLVSNPYGLGQDKNFQL